MDEQREAVGSLRNVSHICDVIETTAREAPERAFILFGDGRVPALTFGELATRARGFAAAYRAMGLAPGCTLVLMLVTHRDAAPAFFGAILAGIVPTLFPPLTPKQDPEIFWPAHLAVFERIDVAAVLVDGAASAPAGRLGAFADRIFDINLIDVGRAGEDVPHRLPRPGRALGAEDRAIAFLQHSSGTTGSKKGVVMTHRAVLDMVEAARAPLAMTRDDVVATWLPIYHDMGLINCLVMPALLGQTVVQLDPFDWVVRPTILLDCIEAHRATMCWMPNFAFQHVLRAARSGRIWDLSSLRVLINAGEPCRAETMDAFGGFFAAHGLRPTAIQVAYGMAENVCIATVTGLARGWRQVDCDAGALQADGVVAPPRDGAPASRFVGVGRPIDTVAVAIEDAARNRLGERRVGEIVLESGFLFDGYYRLAMPAGKLEAGWYRTGDLGFVDAGELFVCGRVDDLLIVHGKNLYAHDVEHVVNKVAGVRAGRVVAFAPFNPRAGSNALVVVAETDHPEGEERLALRRRIQGLLAAEFGIDPYDVLVTGPGWLVKTTSGKIGRGANEARYVAENPRIARG